MQQNPVNDMDAVLQAGASLGMTKIVGDVPFAVVPSGYRLESLEKLLQAPSRQRGTAEVSDADSFIAYVNRHKGDATDLYFQVNPSPSFTAVFNAPRPGQPGWSDFRAHYACPLSPAWQTWTAHDGKRMGQEEFARFIEANLPDIVQPEAADMLEIALSLEAKKKVNFASGLRLSNGANELTYEEQIEGSAAKGKLQIPEKIVLGIPVFENGQGYSVEANFRYRIAEGKLAMWYELVRTHVIVEDAVAELRKVIDEQTGLVALNGKPA